MQTLSLEHNSSGSFAKTVIRNCDPAGEWTLKNGFLPRRIWRVWLASPLAAQKSKGESKMPSTWVRQNTFCNTCLLAGRGDVVARFRAATKQGIWGNFCPSCWKVFCRPHLGVEVGQLIVRDSENPLEVARDLGVEGKVLVGVVARGAAA
jgi:hypothetical protein